jgi:hypothetical protein
MGGCACGHAWCAADFINGLEPAVSGKLVTATSGARRRPLARSLTGLATHLGSQHEHKG